jgi:diacylglycerol kinase family enzyme
MASYYQRRATRCARIAFITVQRITVLLNPRAGTQDEAVADRVAAAFRLSQAGDPDIRLTEGRLLHDAAAEALSRGPSVVVAAGGDGTVSAVASAIAGSQAALGILPLGTLNHFAKDVGVPLDLHEAVRAIIGRRIRRIDVGELNGCRFINNVSVGMYARLIAEREAMQRLGRGRWIAHGLAAWRVWRRYRRLRIALHTDGHGRSVRTPFVFVGNNEYQLSGLELGARRALDAGRLHVCMAPGMSRRGVARMIVTAIFGDMGRLDGFESFTAAELRLDAGVVQLNASIDGEVVAFDNPLTFRISAGALGVIVP